MRTGADENSDPVDFEYEVRSDAEGRTLTTAAQDHQFVEFERRSGRWRFLRVRVEPSK
jgi:hypothetical protein